MDTFFDHVKKFDNCRQDYYHKFAIYQSQQKKQVKVCKKKDKKKSDNSVIYNNDNKNPMNVEELGKYEQMITTKYSQLRELESTSKKIA